MFSLGQVRGRSFLPRFPSPLARCGEPGRKQHLEVMALVPGMQVPLRPPDSSTHQPWDVPCLNITVLFSKMDNNTPHVASMGKWKCKAFAFEQGT